MIGQIVDGHEILRPLGAGGMGEVYLAQAPDGELRAIKLVRTDRAASPQATARFRREVLALDTLRHPGIVQILDAGQLPDGGLYLAMEYVAGPDLAHAIDEGGAFAVSEALLILSRVANALAYAHDAGIVHRDLKPANIVLANGDPAQAKIIDFGLAKIVADEGLTLTDESQVLGSPGYWAPEQTKTARVGPEVDVYALGALAYFVLSGKPMFCARPAVAMIYAHAHETPEPLANRGVDASAELVELVRLCVAKSAADRPTTADVAAAFTRMAAAAPAHTRARRPSRPALDKPKTAFGEAVANQIRHVLLDLAAALHHSVDDIERIQHELAELELELAMEANAKTTGDVARLHALLGDAFGSLHDEVDARRGDAPPDARALYDELDALVERSHSQ
jgi:serine/threonine protein kinase